MDDQGDTTREGGEATNNTNSQDLMVAYDAHPTMLEHRNISGNQNEPTMIMKSESPFILSEP